MRLALEIRHIHLIIIINHQLPYARCRQNNGSNPAKRTGADDHYLRIEKFFLAMTADFFHQKMSFVSLELFGCHFANP